jgi:hypothetical protein
MSASPNPAIGPEPITFSAQVCCDQADTPITGSVSFTENWTWLCTGMISADAAQCQASLGEQPGLYSVVGTTLVQISFLIAAVICTKTRLSL